MSADQSFYLTCALMMVAGLLIVGCAAIVGRFNSDVSGFILVLGLACFCMGPTMALIGPS